MRREGFLSRWSRLKRDSAAAQTETPPDPAEPDDAVLPDTAEPSPELSIDQLRSLWRNDPALSSADPLEIHNLDYPAPDGATLVESVWLLSQRLLDGNAAPKTQMDEATPAATPDAEKKPSVKD